jgi:hypothetical protein
MRSTGSPTRSRTEAAATIVFDRHVDWAIGAVLALVGLLGTALGGALYYAVNRPDVADLIHNSEFQSEILTEAEAIDALVAVGQWTGLGLVVAGLLTVLVGVAVVIAHGRARRAGRSTPRWIVALVGGLVGIVLGFLPFSPGIGGAVAGYLDPNRTASGFGIGAISGLFAAIPMVIVAGFTSVGLFIGLPTEAVVAVLSVVSIVSVFAAAIGLALSAVGGYAGHWIREQ